MNTTAPNQPIAANPYQLFIRPCKFGKRLFFTMLVTTNSHSPAKITHARLKNLAQEGLHFFCHIGQNYPMKFKCVIFDLDGTLIDTIADIAASMNRALTAYHFPAVPLEAYRDMVGWGIRRLASLALPAEARAAGGKSRGGCYGVLRGKAAGSFKVVSGYAGTYQPTASEKD
jgi:hypothetical protein